MRWRSGFIHGPFFWGGSLSLNLETYYRRIFVTSDVGIYNLKIKAIEHICSDGSGGSRGKYLERGKCLPEIVASKAPEWRRKKRWV